MKYLPCEARVASVSDWLRNLGEVPIHVEWDGFKANFPQLWTLAHELVQ